MTISCPKCGQHYDVGQEYIGYMLDCETCGGQFLVRQPTRIPLSAVRKTDVQPVTHEQEQVPEPSAVVTQADENPSTITQSAKPSVKPLVCEMCGSSDMIKSDGIFVCQSCGTKYSVEEAKKMMIAGTVKVTGTVKVDNSDKLANLYKLARRAKEAGDFSHAARYYEMVLQEDADNWEATFYSVLCRASECKIAGISDAAMSLHNVFDNVGMLIDAGVQDIDTRREIYQEISNCIVNIGTLFYNASNNQYGGTGEQYKTDSLAISNMCLEAGNMLLGKHKHQAESVDKESFLALWKLSVDIRGNSATGTWQRLKDIETIKEWDPEYKDPESWQMTWRGIWRAIVLLGLTYLACWLFDWDIPHMVRWIICYAAYESRKFF